MKFRLSLVAVILVLALPAFAKPPRIGVFIPGVREGSPTYSDLAAGAERLAAEIPGASVKIFEAGFNQAEWQEKLTSFVATGNYDFILTSNPSLPDLIEAISPMFPKQKFISLDGMKPGNPNLYTVLYNQTEQGYITGYLAGLLSLSSLPGANAAKKVGLIIGQHYPVMDKLIIPGFEQGLKAADPARSMIDSGVDVILPICGSASQGVIKTAQDAGKYLVFFDSDEYARAPKTILGCTALRQENLAYTKLKEAVEGRLAFGKADIVGMKEGYIELLNGNPSYLDGVPKSVQAKVAEAIARIKNGSLSFKVPQL
jgi:simple sugar transport system substrate-binding protein